MNDNVPQTQSMLSPKYSATPGNGKAAAGDLPGSPAPPHDEIARRAYEIYNETGRRQGCCHENWEQAERELQRECRAEQAPPLNERSSDEDEYVHPRAVRTFPAAIDAMLRSSSSTHGISPQGPSGNVRADS